MMRYSGDNGEIKRLVNAKGVNTKINSIIFPGVYIAENSTVSNSVIMRGVRILSNVSVNKAIICEDAVVNENNVIDGNESVILIGDNVNVKPGTYSCREKQKC